MAALAKDPAQRWQCAEDFAEALEAARAQIAAGGNGAGHRAHRAACRGRCRPPMAGLPTGDAPLAERAERKRRRWPWFTLGLLTLLARWRCSLYLAFSGLLAGRAGRRAEASWASSSMQARASARARGLRGRQPSACGAPGRSTRWSTRTRTRRARPRRARPSRSRSRTARATSRVPSVENLPRSQAVKELNKAGLKVNRSTREPRTGQGGPRDPHGAAGGRPRSNGHARAPVRQLRARAGHGAGRGRPVARLGGVAAARRRLRGGGARRRSRTSRRAR